MDLHTIKIFAEYSLFGLYSVGVLGFFIFALTFLSTSFKHFAITMLITPVWFLFLLVALFRQKKASKKSPQYIEIRR